MTVRTVELHLSRAYGKLGIGSRESLGKLGRASSRRTRSDVAETVELSVRKVREPRMSRSRGTRFALRGEPQGLPLAEADGMTTTLITPDQHSTTTTVLARGAAYGAAAWALGFAGLNLYLQLVGIDDAQIQQNWAAFTTINLGVIALKVFGAVVALATVHRWGRSIPAWLVSVCAWGAGAMLLLYAGYGLVGLAATGELLGWVLAGGTWRLPALVYLGFFAVGGGLFAVAARIHQRRSTVRRVWALLGALGAPLLLGLVLVCTSLVF